MSQMNCIQNLREGYAVQNHRIQQLEFQAQRDEYMYKSRIDCLETFINNLRSEVSWWNILLNYIWLEDFFKWWNSINIYEINVYNIFSFTFTYI